MNKMLKTFFNRTRAFMLMFGLLLGVNRPMEAQLVTIFNESFDTYEFPGDYVIDKPNNVGLEFLNSIDFTYNTYEDGQMANEGGECIITKNSCKVGHGSDCEWSHPDHTGGGFYLFAVKDGNDGMKIYTKTISVIRGETVEFGVYYRDIDKGYNFKIHALGTGTNGEEKISDNFHGMGTDGSNTNGVPDNGWNFHSFTIIAANDGDVTFNVVDYEAWYSNPRHKFGIDDITIKKKAIEVISPATLNIYTIVNNTVSLQAKYENLATTSYSYVWEKYNGSSWVTATGENAEGSGNATSFTANFIPATESMAGYVYYRLAVISNSGADTYYSDVITVNYTSVAYILNEDFSGNFPSNGASGDWWLMFNPGYNFNDFTYGNGKNEEDIIAEYGQMPVDLPSKTYVITKKAKPHIGWLGDVGDHTFGTDDTKGYFAFGVYNDKDNDAEFYSAEVNVTPGQILEISLWLKNLYANGEVHTDGTFSMTLNVEGIDGNVIESQEITSLYNWQDWNSYSLPFKIPDTYSGNSVTISIIANAGDYMFGIDDITVVEFNASVEISSPATGTYYCDWNGVVMDVAYSVLNAVEYKWQYSTDGSDSSWSDISDATGTLDVPSGTFIRSFTFLNSQNSAGYYRVMVTAQAGNYTNATVSNVVQLIARESLNKDNIKYSNVSTNADEAIIVTVEYAESLGNPKYEWKDTSIEGWPVIKEGTEYEIPAIQTNVPASGTIKYSSPYLVDISSDEYCTTGEYAVVNIINERWNEDFKTGDSDRIAKADAEKRYIIPASNFSYLSDTNETIPGHCYLFTKSTIQREDGRECEDILDSSGEGYFLQASVYPHDADTSPIKFYETTVEACAGGKYSFTAEIANLFPVTYHKLQFRFRVTFEEINGNVTEEKTYITEEKVVYDAGWKEYGFDFMVPNGTQNGATFKVTCTIESTGYLWGQDRKDFGMDNVAIKRLPPVQIMIPGSMDIKVLKGTKVDIEGLYACGSGYNPNASDSPNSFIWQISTDGSNWNDVTSEDIDGTSGASRITTLGIEEPRYFRIEVEASKSGEEELYFHSDPLKITPLETSDLGKTYYICPDNMGDEEAEIYVKRDGEGKFLPGMKSDGEPGYLPSLIHMEVPELYGTTYKWYNENNEFIDDQDDYDKDQLFDTEDEIDDPIILPDGKSSTLAVMNERRINGAFIKRTYWVELYNSNGDRIGDEDDRIEVKLEPGYLCGSTETDIFSHAMVSPNTARRIHRENFGGTLDSDPEISITPLSGIDYQFDMSNSEDVKEGGYKVKKLSPELSGDSWFSIKDHIYSDVPNENPHGYSVAVNASEDPGLFYTYRLENLGSCDGLNLLFTGWFTSPVNWKGTEKANLMFKLINTDTDDVLAEFVTGNMIDNDVRWRQFGFMFEKQPGVDNLTLEIINNNFGTAGGNDVLMDDMEIYLAIPPVTLVPALNGYVCVDNETELTGTATLGGNYTDDGTLGRNLDYRWEYSTDKINWDSLGAQDGNGDPYSEGFGSVENGVITTSQSLFTIKGFTSANDGYYRLTVGKAGVFDGTPNYDCMGASEARSLIFSGTIAEFPTPTFDTDDVNNMNMTAVCYPAENATGQYLRITNFDDPESIGDDDIYADYYWIVDGAVVQKKGDVNASATKLELDLSGYTPGYHTVSFMVINAADCDKTITHNFLIYPKTTTWTAEGNVNNWNDYRNWSNGVPGDCTQAIIPNKSISVDENVLLEHYPVLKTPTVETLNEITSTSEKSAYASNQENLSRQQETKNDEEFSLRPACDTITFKMGAFVNRTDYLNYNFAKVDLDVLPNRWCMLSAPLRDMYSGDYFEEKSFKRQLPITYMRKFNATNPETKEQLGAGWSKSFNTLTEILYPGLGFIIWADDGNEIGQNEEIQSYRFPRDSMKYAMYSKYYEYLYSVDIPSREYMGRFTYEELIDMNGNLPESATGFKVTVKEDNASYLTTLVGNPFMSYLDFNKFTAANDNVSNGGYYIWNGYSFDAIKPEDADFNDQHLIAPMQSFVVEKTGKVDNLTFTFDMVSETAASGGVLRSARANGRENPVLRMAVLRNGVEHSNLRLKYDPQANNKYSEEKDMWTMFTASEKGSAVLYSLLDGKAASIRTLGDLSERIELGIRTTTKGMLTLHLTGLEKLDEYYDIYLEDVVANVSQNLRENPVYTFNNQSGNVEGRLFLNVVEDVITENDKLSADSDIRVYTTDNTIKVTSSVGNPIQTVSIYSVHGELLYSNTAIGISTHSVEMASAKQVLIVAVTTQKTQKNTKVVLK